MYDLVRYNAPITSPASADYVPHRRKLLRTTYDVVLQLPATPEVQPHSTAYVLALKAALGWMHVKPYFLAMTSVAFNAF